MDTICKRGVGRREAESDQDIQTRIRPRTYQIIAGFHLSCDQNVKIVNIR